MESLLHEVFTARITAFLDAVGQSMNSNSMLLKVKADSKIPKIEADPNHPTSIEDVLSGFIRSRLFTDMVLDWDLQKGWYNYHIFDISSDKWMPKHDGQILIKNRLKYHPMSAFAFAERLYWMLRTAFSPYNRRPDESYAKQCIAEFWLEIFGDDIPNPQKSPEQWIERI